MATFEATCVGSHEGLDGMPVVAPAFGGGCGRTFSVTVNDGDPTAGPETWSVKTDDNGNVVSRHATVTCPDCGRHSFVRESDVV